MAVTQNTYTGNGSTTNYSFTFPYLDETDIKVTLNGSLTTAYTLANATTIQFNTAPANGTTIRIYRLTDDSSLVASFYPGSAIRAQDLSSNFTQTLFVSQETSNYSLKDVGSVTLLANYTYSGLVTFVQSPVGPTPTSSNHLATKGYVDGFVKDVGNLTLTANYTFSNPVNVATPTSPSHATTKAYVDTYATNQGNVTAGSKGDITVSVNLATWTINANAIDSTRLASSSVTTPKIAAGAVTPDKLDRAYSRRSYCYFSSGF